MTRRLVRMPAFAALLTIFAYGFSLNGASAAQATFALTSFSLSPDSTLSGQSVMARISVQNVGKGAANSTLVVFWMTPAGQSLTSASRIGEASLGTVQPGKTLTVISTLPISSSMPSGAYHIVAEVKAAKTGTTTASASASMTVYSSSTWTASTSTSSTSYLPRLRNPPRRPGRRRRRPTPRPRPEVLHPAIPLRRGLRVPTPRVALRRRPHRRRPPVPRRAITMHHRTVREMAAQPRHRSRSEAFGLWLPRVEHSAFLTAITRVRRI
jgi:hypothetical protein